MKKEAKVSCSKRRRVCVAPASRMGARLLGVRATTRTAPKLSKLLCILPSGNFAGSGAEIYRASRSGSGLKGVSPRPSAFRLSWSPPPGLHGGLHPHHPPSPPPLRAHFRLMHPPGKREKSFEAFWKSYLFLLARITGTGHDRKTSFADSWS